MAVLLSGSGRTLVNLWERIKAGTLDADIGLVVASRECLGAQRARERGLDVKVVPGTIPAERLGSLLRGAGIDWVVLAGYLKLVNIPAACEGETGYAGRVVNIHPALLPGFGGPGMFGMKVHQAVLAAGCKVSGCTVHLCDERYDTGPIVVQRCCPVLEGDTPETLAERVFGLEKEAYPAALELLLSGRVIVEGRRARILSDEEARSRQLGR